jgi:hypothetical protein
MRVIPESVIQYKNTQYSLAFDGRTLQRVLFVEGDHSSFQGEIDSGIYQCPLTPENANALRARLPWLNPVPLGLVTSFGFGDRLGIATPGHVAAVKGTGIAPIFAQQSVRENERTGRSPQIVLDDAMWGIFEMGWREPWGADADHVKNIEDLSHFIASGYSFYTFDPNEYVDNDAHTDPIDVLRQKIAHFPWDALGTSLEELKRIYQSNPIQAGASLLEFQEESLLRALVKYGRAIAHIKALSDYLVHNMDEFDLEVSVDETDTPTTVLEHYYIASELRRLGVPIVSLAPRFIGSFQKGVDYIGDIKAFDAELKHHVDVMQHIGGYKLSVHTGSDKLSIYPSIAKQTHNLVHVKTAGTSYLEGLRVVLNVDKPFFREILDFARSHYEADRATYHLDGRVEEVPPSNALSDEELPGLLEQFDARQVLHVTFGSVVDHYRERLMDVLTANREVYHRYLQKHFERHLEPFMVQYP